MLVQLASMLSCMVSKIFVIEFRHASKESMCALRSGGDHKRVGKWL